MFFSFFIFISSFFTFLQIYILHNVPLSLPPGRAEAEPPVRRQLEAAAHQAAARDQGQEGQGRVQVVIFCQ